MEHKLAIALDVNGLCWHKMLFNWGTVHQYYWQIIIIIIVFTIIMFYYYQILIQIHSIQFVQWNEMSLQSFSEIKQAPNQHIPTHTTIKFPFLKRLFVAFGPSFYAFQQIWSQAMLK